MGSESLQTPKVTTRQTGRRNIPGYISEIYYKISILYHFLDHMQTELLASFSQ